MGWKYYLCYWVIFFWDNVTELYLGLIQENEKKFQTSRWQDSIANMKFIFFILKKCKWGIRNTKLGWKSYLGSWVNFYVFLIVESVEAGKYLGLTSSLVKKKKIS